MSPMGKTQIHRASSRNKSSSARLQRSRTVQQNLHEFGQGKMPVDSREREQFIATAAYYRAQQRGFVPGNELEDWLHAEAEVDRFLLGEQLSESARSLGNSRSLKGS